MNTADLLKQLTGGLNRTIPVGNESYTYFSGTDYLGMSQHPDFIELYIEGIRKWGINNGTSRNNNVQLKVYQEAESFAAAAFHAPDSIICSSGFLAGQMTVRCFQHAGEVIFAPGAHPALWLQDQPHTAATTFQEWLQQTIEYINQSSQQQFIVIANAVDIFIPARHSFADFKQVSPHKNILLIVDDSHGIGFTGLHGAGIYQELPQQSNIQLLVVASMAKGLGIRAGIIMGNTALLSEIRQKGMYIGASPATPASIYAFTKAASIYAQQLDILLQNIRYFIGHMKSKFNYSEELPIFVADDPSLYQQLLAQKIVISSFPYPGINDPLYNRIILSAAHSKEDIDLLLAALRPL